MGFVKNICLICAWFSAAGGGEGTNWLTEIPWPVYSNRRLRWEAAEEEPILKIFILTVEWLFRGIDLSSACNIQLLKERFWGLLRWRLCLFCSAHTLCICPFCFPAARLLWRVRILWQNTGLTELLVKSIWSWAACLEYFHAGGFLFMGWYGELVKPADCKSVTLVVNIAGSSPARPTICSRVPTGRGIRLKPGSVRVQIPPGVRHTVMPL